MLPPKQLETLGFRIAAYPLTLLSAAVRAMQGALDALAAGRHPDTLLPFEELRELVGFSEYDREQLRYHTEE